MSDTRNSDGGTVMLGGPAHMTRAYVDPKSRNHLQWASDDKDKPPTLYRFERVAFGREGYVEVLVHDSLTLDEALPFVHRWIIETMGGTLRPAEAAAERMGP